MIDFKKLLKKKTEEEKQAREIKEAKELAERKEKNKKVIIYGSILCVVGIALLGVLSVFEETEQNGAQVETKQTESQRDVKETAEKTIEDTTVEEEETTADIITEINQDEIDSINRDISERLMLEKGWAFGLLDGNGNETSSGTPDESRKWSTVVLESKYDGDKLSVIVDDSFNRLLEDEKNEVASMIQGLSIAAITEDMDQDAQLGKMRSGIYTTIKQGGRTVGKSKITNTKEFKWK